MANILQRIIQLVLDKDAAKKVQQDTENVTGKMEETWKSTAAKIAGYLGVAFLTAKVIEFGKRAVEEASSAQVAWSDLKTTIDNTGASFDGLQEKIHKTADAFQDATIHDDDAFAGSLSRLVTLTGDVSASLNNMGLVANVAAKFFKGDLDSATQLVAKAMNGNTNALHKMGIAANSAQEALEILAQRSMGAASREAQTYAGQLKQLNNTYNDLLKAVGNSIIQSDGATDSFSVLKGAVEILTEWVEKNKDSIALWVTNGVKFAIDAADVFIRAVVGMTNILGGGFSTAIGIAAVAVSKFAEGLLYVRAGISALDRFLGKDTSNYDKVTEELTAQTRALGAWGKAAVELGSDRVKKGLETLATPMFSSDSLTGKPKKIAATPGETNKPMVGKNIETEDDKKVKDAIKEYNQAAKAAANMQKILGDKFDATGADVERTTKLLNTLASFGIDPATKGFAGLSDHLKELTDVTIPTTTAAKELSKALAKDFADSALDASTSTDLLANRIDWLKTQQADVQKAMQTLIAAGFDPSSKAVQAYATQWRSLGEDIKAANIQATFQELAQTMQEDLFNAMLDNADRLAQLTSEHDALKKAIQSLIAQGVSKEDEAFKKLVARYGEVTKAINQQTLAMQLQAAMADFLADALGTALQGGLAEAASQKAKQNAIEAAEMLVRAGVFALFGDWPHAQGALVLAGQFAAVATAWAALGAASRSGGGCIVPVMTTGGNVGGSASGTDLTSGRQSSSDSASNAVAPSAEVSVYLVGPGFDALNPEVQRVVWGAQQQAEERYGPNARIRVTQHK